MTFSHPAVADLQFTLQQNVSGPRLSSASTSVTYAAGSYEIDYTIENPREGVTLEADWSGTWITDVSLENNKLKFNVLENNSGSSRTTDIVLTYGDVVVNHQVTQSYSAPSLTLSSSSTSCDYAAASKSFTYALNNPREGQSVKVTCLESWITNLVHEGTKVSFKVAENNSGSSRTGNIVLTYGAVTVNHKVTQSYNASAITCNPASTSCDYASASKSFTYTVSNPREGASVKASCSVSWITNLSQNGTTVSFKVAENNTGSTREGTIVLKYGSVSVKHKVTQSYSAPAITCNPASTSCDYASASKSFTYTLSNPREGQSVKVTCSESWITNLIHEGAPVSFKISENNSGSSRTGNIVLTYGSVIVNHKVEQMRKSVDLSSSKTANCYIISESGAYKFKTVKGNSTTSVGTVSSTVVLWETFGTSTAPKVGDLIKSVSYIDGYITFQTADTFKEGNAVIAAKNSSGTILWSWHIWLTDQPQGQVYYNNAGTMMDRNLGATSATPGDVGALGLLYQWGRKDPFLGSSSISSSTVAKSTITWPSAVSSNSNGTIAYATAHPTTFIKYNSSNYDWYYTGSSSTDNTRWTTSEKTKSIYDPCPAGWRVPDGGSNGVWSKAKGSSSYFIPTYSSTNKGINFSGKFGSASTIWYPAPCYLDYRDGSLDYGDIIGFYWSASPDGNDSYGLRFLYGDGVYLSYSFSSRAYGLSVRCLQVID